MKPPWAGKRRDANEQEIVDALKAAGASVRRLHVPADLLIGYRGQTWLIEVKTKHGWSFTAAEREFRLQWHGQLAVVQTAEQALRLIGAIT